MKKCVSCGQTYTNEELKELKEAGEPIGMNPFLCPDCFDDFQKMNLEDQLIFLMKVNCK